MLKLIMKLRHEQSMKIARSSLRKQKGFTIVELMIATAVFSFVLLITSAGVIAVGRAYYKSLTSNRVHETARSVLDDISRSLQFSDPGTVTSQTSDPDGTGVIVRCFGQDRYRYFINRQVNGANHGLYRDKRPSASTCNGCDSAGLQLNGVNCVHPGVFSGGQELMGNNMRLLQFDVSNADPFHINIRVAYGDNDLLTTYDNQGNPNGGDPSTALCKTGIAGNNFCAVSALETTVTGRVE